MNRLKAVQQLSRKAGVDFTGPSTTVGQTGVFLQLTEWYDEAYNEIQNVHTTWQFHRNEFSKTLTASKGTYTPTELGLTNFREYAPEDWRIYLLAADEAEIAYLEWKDFRATYQLGNLISQTGRPIAFSVKPNDDIVFYPIPNDAFTVKGEYFIKNDIISTDEGEPIFLEDFHWVIIWIALTYYATEYSEPDKFTVGNSKSKKIIRNMEKKYLPRVTWGQPLV